MRSLVDSFRGLAHEKGVRLSCRLPADSVNIFIDPDRISEVVTNLVDNALKFTPARGRIEVVASVFESKVRICVSDNGIGIPRQHLGRIFSRFEQPKHASRYAKGLGLGLSIVKELVERHGGEIWVESAPGKGSQFYFTLPRFYSTQLVDTATRARINELLDNDVTLHLINLLVVNFQGFMRIAGHEQGKEITAGLDTVIEKSLREFKQRWHNRDVFVSDFRQGECTIVIPRAEEDAVASLCTLFRQRINAYLRSFRIKDCFINVGVLEFLYKDSRQSARAAGAAIYVKKIFIGAEKRRCRRIAYHLRLEPVFSSKSFGETYSLDISRHGICFLSTTPIRTNAVLAIRLDMPRRQRPLSVTGRVAWMKEIVDEQGKGRTRYKIGVEFVRLSGATQRELDRLVASLTKVRPCAAHNNS